MSDVGESSSSLPREFKRPKLDSSRRNHSGGREALDPDKIDASTATDFQRSISSDSPLPAECRLIVLQITDVYTLQHLASFKTLIEDTKKKNPGAKVISMLTGDFLSPYLLSAIDQGKGMMNALNKLPLDYLTWGNHEADISHRVVCEHVRNFKGKAWINSNMLDHQAMDHQVEYEIIDLTSPDGTQHRKVGLVAVLSDDPKLYASFKAPGAFGGATITDPWEALKKYQRILMDDKGVDMILPLQHLYVPDDHKTCQNFDFPVILSGHDHHRVDETVNGTRLLKPGMNAVYATMLEICWPNKDNGNENINAPFIDAKFVKVEDWDADPELEIENEKAYDALEPLRNTELARVPTRFEPLSSNNSRGSVCTMGTYICSLLKSSLSVTRRQRSHRVDAVLLMGGNIRGNADYDKGSYFSMEMLESEVKDNEVVGTVDMPGWLLAKGVQATHLGDPKPGWMQYDWGVLEVCEGSDGSLPVVTHVNSQPLEKDKLYRVATKISDLTNGQSPPWTEYYKANPHLLPPKGAYVNIHSELISYFGRNLWRKTWDAMTEIIQRERANNNEMVASDDNKNGDCNCYAEFRLSQLDTDGDGTVTVQDLQTALAEMLGYSIDPRETTLAEYVHRFADTTGDGTVTLKDFELFCQEMKETYQRDSWRLSHPKKSTLVRRATA